MAGLEIDYETIQNSICDIERLSACYPAVIRPAASGEGQGIEEIEQLADLYASFYGAMERLSEETVIYLNNMVEEFKNADEKRMKTPVDNGKVTGQ